MPATIGSPTYPQRGDVDWRFPITVERMVLAGRYAHLGWLRLPGPVDLAHVATVLRQLGLTDLAKRQIGQLSGGQQQRALLARALVQEADLLLLDEPLSAVDSTSRTIIAEVLNDLVASGRATVDVVRTTGAWMGITYTEDLEPTRIALAHRFT